MAAYTTTLTFNNSDPSACTWSGTWPINMQPGDTLAISFSSFPAGSKLSAVTLTGGGNTITFPPSPAAGSDFLITAVATTPPFDVTNPAFSVTITDNQGPASAVDYTMVVSGATFTGFVWSSSSVQVIANPA